MSTGSFAIAGVQNFYYGKSVPARSVGIAKVNVPPLTPAQLTDINNTVFDQGPLSIWKTTTSLMSPADYTAADYNLAVNISGIATYTVGNQFFEITNQFAADDETLLFYRHQLPPGATHVQIINLDGSLVDTVTFISAANVLYHSLDGLPYRVQFINAQGYLVQQVLQYVNVVQRASSFPQPGSYTLRGSLLTLNDSGSYWIRFTQPNGYQAMPMYTYLPNTPWYLRIRYGLTPPPVDWGFQNFLPSAPYLPASFIAGTVLDTHMVQFERRNIYQDASHLPDILVFDKDQNFKYALDGFVATGGGTDNPPFLKGYIYPWQFGQITSMDPNYARIDVAVELDPTDIVWAFYTYAEQDVIYTGFDCNPFTNPIAKDTILQVYAKFVDGDPNQNIYHQLLDSTGAPIAGQTDDPNPTMGTNYVFASVAVGSNVSQIDFSFTDIRQRGGGLDPLYFAKIPQAVNFWDIGYWDGKPYPFAGALAIYLPYDILQTLSASDIQGRINSALPMGAMAVIRYIDSEGNEYVVPTG